jgi:hypothetical protein
VAVNQEKKTMKRTNRKRKASGSSSTGSNLGPTGSGRTPKEYIVERILDRRQRNGVTEYLLKWHGYSNSHNSWEPEENILSQKMLDDFNERFEQQSQRNHVKSPQCGSEMSSVSSGSLMLSSETNGRGSSSSIENVLNYNRFKPIVSDHGGPSETGSDGVLHTSHYSPTSDLSEMANGLERTKLNIRNLAQKAL